MTVEERKCLFKTLLKIQMLPKNYQNRVWESSLSQWWPCVYSNFTNCSSSSVILWMTERTTEFKKKLVLFVVFLFVDTVQEWNISISSHAYRLLLLLHPLCFGHLCHKLITRHCLYTFYSIGQKFWRLIFHGG